MGEKKKSYRCVTGSVVRVERGEGGAGELCVRIEKSGRKKEGGSQ